MDINIFLQPMWGCRQLELANITRAVMKTEGKDLSLEAVLAMTIEPVTFNMRLASSGENSSVSLTRSDKYSDTSHCVPGAEQGARQYCICPEIVR